ncbi:MAG: Lrp/AsnC family transcriptional regulator [Eubacteriales bacterium]|nr:Lrp/AsnC family transcriptional regulator [Eubacteriales bacterium]
MQKNTLDAVDKKILNILMVEAKRPLKEIAEAVFFSVPAVSARIEKLEKEGYIRGYQAQVDPVLTGFPARAFIQVAVAQEDKEEFYAYVQGCREVAECCCVTGEYSMMLKVCLPTMEELESFAGRLGRFGKTQTHVVFSVSVPHRGVAITEECSKGI